MAPSIFVTATDTDAGKTYVTSSLVRALKDGGRNVIALKPVACGNADHAVNEDVAALLAAQDLPTSEAASINLYSFDAAQAPAQAAAEEGRCIDPQKLVAWCETQARGHELILIEGVGGLMVPLCDDYLVSDWLHDMPALDVLLVVRARLGGINHALLTLDKLHHMGRAPGWVVINDADGVGKDMLDRHVQVLAERAGSATVICLPHAASLATLDQLAARL